MRESREGGGGQGVWTPPGKSQVAVGFLRNSGMDQPREALGSLGPVRPSVTYLDD